MNLPSEEKCTTSVLSSGSNGVHFRSASENSLTPTDPVPVFTEESRNLSSDEASQTAPQLSPSFSIFEPSTGTFQIESLETSVSWPPR